MTRRLAAPALAVLALASSFARGAGAEPPAPPLDPAAFLAAKAPTVVNVRGVLTTRVSMGGQSRDQERKVEGLGTIVDPSGLVVVPGQTIGDLGDIGDMLRQMGITFTVEPKDVKVIVGGDGRERATVTVARDTNLNLAFVQILGDEGKPFAAADLGGKAEPRLGERLLAVGRKTEAFDHAPLLLRLYASNLIERPKRMWGIEGDHLAAGLASTKGGFRANTAFVGGTPAYDAAGRPVGLLSSQLGAPGDDPSERASTDAILPLDAVAGAVAKALKLAPEAVAKAKAAQDAK